MRDTDHIDTHYVTTAIKNGKCTPTLVEELHDYIQKLHDAFDICEDGIVDDLLDQWRGE